MKLCYCSISKIPSREANSIHIMKMCQAFSECKIDVILLSSDQSKNDENVFDFYNVKQCFKFSYVKWPSRFRLKALRYAIRAVSRCKKEKADIFYSRDVTCSLIAALNGIPSVWESHTAISNLGRAAEKQFCMLARNKNLRKIVVISEKLKEYYIEKYGVCSDMIWVAPDGADPVDTSCRPKTEIIQSNFLNIGYIGQLYKGKGMEIISELVPKCPNAFFHIVGGMEKDIEYWKSTLSKYSNIKFYGFVLPKHTPEYGIAMDVLIAPYMRKVVCAGDKNGGNDIGKWMSPLKIFEYMSYGKAILSSDLEVLREVLVNQENAILCDPDKIDEWVVAINSLEKNLILRNELGDKAKNDFQMNYTWRKRAEHILSAIGCYASTGE